VANRPSNCFCFHIFKKDPTNNERIRENNDEEISTVEGFDDEDIGTDFDVGRW